MQFEQEFVNEHLESDKGLAYRPFGLFLMEASI
jgi:hypothetical protein